MQMTKWRTKIDASVDYQVYGERRVMPDHMTVEDVEAYKDRMRFECFTKAWKDGYTPIEESWDTHQEWNLLATEYVLWFLCTRHN